MENKQSLHVCGTCGGYDELIDSCRNGMSVRKNRVSQEGCKKWECEKGRKRDL